MTKGLIMLAFLVGSNGTAVATYNTIDTLELALSQLEVSLAVKFSEKGFDELFPTRFEPRQVFYEDWCGLIYVEQQPEYHYQLIKEVHSWVPINGAPKILRYWQVSF